MRNSIVSETCENTFLIALFNIQGNPVHRLKVAYLKMRHGDIQQPTLKQQ